MKIINIAEKLLIIIVNYLKAFFNFYYYNFKIFNEKIF